MAEDPLSDESLAVMGGRFGKFVGSFMREVQPGQPGVPGGIPQVPAGGMTESAPQGGAIQGGTVFPGDERERFETRRHEFPAYRYDPWGARRWGNPMLDYDPWGVAGFADQDWTLGRNYYGLGFGPWAHEDPFGPGGYGPDPRGPVHYGPDPRGPEHYGPDPRGPEHYGPGEYAPEAFGPGGHGTGGPGYWRPDDFYTEGPRSGPYGLPGGYARW